MYLPCEEGFVPFCSILVTVPFVCICSQRVDGLVVKQTAQLRQRIEQQRKELEAVRAAEKAAKKVGCFELCNLCDGTLLFQSFIMTTFRTIGPSKQRAWSSKDSCAIGIHECQRIKCCKGSQCSQYCATYCSLIWNV